MRSAEPAKQHPRWRAAEVKSLVKFTVDNSSFMLLRDESYFALFSGDGSFLKSFTRLIDDLAPYLASIFEFGLVLASRQETPQIPPPAFLFLPFYMDQDASWQNAWNGFDRLAQYAGWKSPLVDYHTGIRDNAYYAVSAGAIKKQSSLNELLSQEKGITAVAKKLDSDTSTATFSLHPEVFDDQIKRLLSESEALLGQENKLKEKLTKLANERQLQRTRLAIAKQALGELSADFNFLTHAHTEEIECPNHTTYLSAGPANVARPWRSRSKSGYQQSCKVRSHGCQRPTRSLRPASALCPFTPKMGANGCPSCARPLYGRRDDVRLLSSGSVADAGSPTILLYGSKNLICEKNLIREKNLVGENLMGEESKDGTPAQQSKDDQRKNKGEFVK